MLPHLKDQEEEQQEGNNPRESPSTEDQRLIGDGNSRFTQHDDDRAGDTAHHEAATDVVDE